MISSTTSVSGLLLLVLASSSSIMSVQATPLPSQRNVNINNNGLAAAPLLGDNYKVFTKDGDRRVKSLVNLRKRDLTPSQIYSMGIPPPPASVASATATGAPAAVAAAAPATPLVVGGQPPVAAAVPAVAPTNVTSQMTPEQNQAIYNQGAAFAAAADAATLNNATTPAAVASMPAAVPAAPITAPAVAPAAVAPAAIPAPANAVAQSAPTIMMVGPASSAPGGMSAQDIYKQGATYAAAADRASA